jgi:hypothetical protein
MTGPSDGLRISWQHNTLSISGQGIPGSPIEINYLEAFCRPGSQDRDWSETTIPHRTQLLSAGDDGHRLHLASTLADGVVVSHTITAGTDEVDFRLAAHNPTTDRSQAHWAQPCIRVGGFTGLGTPQPSYEYIRNCFIFLADALTRMPTPGWATEARYTPGQVWSPAGVPRTDVNPRPLNPLTPSNGLIGCFSQDGALILATAWEPYQELFQGVLHCIHSDFRIGGLEPGERKEIRGKIYIVPSDVNALLDRYRRDFPEQTAIHPQTSPTPV